MAKVGNYRLLGQLGQGGMADIMLAVLESSTSAAHAQFTKLVVLKRLRRALDAEHVTMFFDEARLAARLSHPNVVQTNEVGESQGVYFMVMEYLQGQPFDRLLRRMQKGGIPRTAAHVELCLYVLAESLAGLHYAHDAQDFDGTPLGLVHRDFSPHNVFVTYDGQVKVLDFGVAKAERRSHHTSTGLVKGKLRYMAPEQAMAMPLDRRADLFAAGVILQEITSGTRMWSAEMTDSDVLRALFDGRFTARVKGASPALNTILERALTREPADRYASAALMRRDLLAYLRAAGRDVESLREGLAQLLQKEFADDRAHVAEVIKKALATTAPVPATPEEPESGKFELLPVADDAPVAQPVASLQPAPPLSPPVLSVAPAPSNPLPTSPPVAPPAPAIAQPAPPSDSRPAPRIASFAATLPLAAPTPAPPQLALAPTTAGGDRTAITQTLPSDSEAAWTPTPARRSARWPWLVAALLMVLGVGAVAVLKPGSPSVDAELPEAELPTSVAAAPPVPAPALPSAAELPPLAQSVQEPAQMPAAGPSSNASAARARPRPPARKSSAAIDETYPGGGR